ncbi:MAG: alpha/beta fold hydrolase [Verrucomicrobiota bacterium]
MGGETMTRALHGMLGRPGDWDSLPELELHAVDLFEVDPKPMPEWGKQFSRIEGNESASRVLLGYSMGGRLALHALLTDPGRWRSAIIVSAHPGLRHAADREIRLRNDQEWARKVRTQEWEAFLEEWNAQPVFGGADLMGSTAPGATRRERMALAFERWSLGRQEDLRGQFRRIDFPVLWVTGERDSKFCELASEAVAGFPLFRHEVVGNAGHRVPWERPEEFQSIVLAFLRECGIE